MPVMACGATPCANGTQMKQWGQIRGVISSRAHYPWKGPRGAKTLYFSHLGHKVGQQSARTGPHVEEARHGLSAAHGPHGGCRDAFEARLDLEPWVEAAHGPTLA
jgi:hypothetical protein